MREKNSQALYRRYRSTSFDELIGQEHVTELLKESVASGNISHAYLFTGQKGTGKTSAARILAYAINDLPYDADAGHLDIIEIDAASNRRIDDIRDLREKVFIAPVSAKYKVYIIDEVHMLTGESFNALLKTLEEPPAHAVFILATTELSKVPATIVSRVQRFHFRPVPSQKVVQHLSGIAKKEHIDIDESALALIAQYGGGSFRDSIGLLDQVSGLKQHIDAALIENILGRASSQIVSEIMRALEEKNEPQLRNLLDEVTTGGVSPVTLSEQLVAAILARKNNTRQWYELAEKLMTIPKAHFASLLLTSSLLKFVATTEGKRDQPKPVEEAPTKTPSTPQAPPEKPKKEATANTETGTFDWQAVLEAAKKHAAALYSVLARAEEKHTDTTLTLAFQYPLHRKKMAQAQYKTELAKLIHDVCHVSMDIFIASTPQLETNETAASVAEIMGGGEVVRI